MDSFSEPVGDDSTNKKSPPQVAMSPTSYAIAKPKKKRFPWAIPIIIILMLAGTGRYLFSRRQDSQPNLESLTVPAQTQTLKVVTEASGTIEPIDSVNISPKTTGRLTALYVEQGDEVKAGQLLAKMDSANLKAELAQAQAELAQAEAEYARVVNGNRSEAIARAKSQVRSAQAQADLAAKKLEKNRFLARQGAIAQLTLDEYISEEQTARANLIEAREQLQELETGSRPEDIEQYQARVRAAQAKVALAQTRLDDTEIRAPFDGIVSQKYAVVGSIVTPDVSASATSSATSSSILSIASQLEVNVNVSEASIAQIELDRTVEIVADAYPNQTFKGRVKQIAPEAVVENNVTSFEVKVELISGQTELRSGMNVDALFIGKTIENALTIPTVAITTSQGEIGVMVASETGEAEFQPVTVGLSQDGQTQIIQGLERGDLVFIDAPPEKQSLLRNKE
ncbi:MAG: efflux RND transporter periplasmic adaptor subunit [Pleurocapsa sp. MO_226.B13]|nr:efflux RND transporter periplasmic adaptor subunit [Pleurocapsa sp. MO_226.B13]